MSFGLFNKKIDNVLPGRVLTDREDLVCYGFDASLKDGIPLAVVKPDDTHDVSKVAAYAFEKNHPIVPRGAGTGMTGGSVPLKNSIILSLEGMNRIIDIDKKNMIACVEPGVINAHLQEQLEEQGLFYPPDPASMKFCTLGGNVAENAGGPRAVKYGVTKDYVLGLETVLPHGRVLNTGGKNYKDVVGYDLTRLMVGSEGTLGVITKIFLKVLPLPEARTVSRITSSSIIPRTLEIMDHESIRAIENYKKYGLPQDADALLLIEVDGSHISVSNDAEKIAAICSYNNGKVSVADDIYSRNRIWEARRSISQALYNIKPSKINEDIVVPRGRVPEMLAELKKISDRYNLIIANFGHAGDGNIHVNIMTDRNDKEEYVKAERAVKDIFEATVKLEGTISGEHGIGLTKKEFIDMELSEVSIKLMKEVKSVFDPKGIMNPGKIFP
jgi:glycolate oxidase